MPLLVMTMKMLLNGLNTSLSSHAIPPFDAEMTLSNFYYVALNSVWRMFKDRRKKNILWITRNKILNPSQTPSHTLTFTHAKVKWGYIKRVYDFLPRKLQLHINCSKISSSSNGIDVRCHLAHRKTLIPIYLQVIYQYIHRDTHRSIAWNGANKLPTDFVKHWDWNGKGIDVYSKLVFMFDIFI